jgi:hypothetical protein
MLGSQKCWAGPIALALLLGASRGATASVTYYSYSQVSPNNDSSVDDGGTGNLNSSATYNTNNFANSFITAGTSTMGAAASSTGFNTARTETTINDTWSCSDQSVCALVPVGGIAIQLTFGIQVSETQVVNDAYIDYEAQYQVDGAGTFQFGFTQDGVGDFELTSQYVSNGNTFDIPVETTLAGGVYTLTASGTLDGFLCANDSCGVDSVSPGAALFNDTELISAETDAEGDPLDVIDAEDPFTINIVSLDPNFEFSSDGGRTILDSLSNSVPEPATWAMFLVGFGGIGFMLRRSRRKGAVATA